MLSKIFCAYIIYNRYVCIFSRYIREPTFGLCGKLVLVGPENKIRNKSKPNTILLFLGALLPNAFFFFFLLDNK